MNKSALKSIYAICLLIAVQTNRINGLFELNNNGKWRCSNLIYSFKFLCIIFCIFVRMENCGHIHFDLKHWICNAIYPIEQNAHFKVHLYKWK